MGSKKRDLLVFQVILLVISDSLGARLIVDSESDAFLRSKILLRSNIDNAFQSDEIKFKLTNLAALTSPHASGEEDGSLQNEKFRTSNPGQRVESTGVRNPLGSNYVENQSLNSDTTIISERQIGMLQIPPQLQSFLAIVQPSFFTITTESSTVGSSSSTAIESGSGSTDTSSGTSTAMESSSGSVDTSSGTSSAIESGSGSTDTSSGTSTAMESSSGSVDTSSGTSSAMESSSGSTDASSGTLTVMESNLISTDTPSETLTTMESSSGSTDTSSGTSTVTESSLMSTDTPSETLTTMESSSGSTDTSSGTSTAMESSSGSVDTSSGTSSAMESSSGSTDASSGTLTVMESNLISTDTPSETLTTMESSSGSTDTSSGTPTATESSLISTDTPSETLTTMESSSGSTDTSFGTSTSSESSTMSVEASDTSSTTAASTSSFVAAPTGPSAIFIFPFIPLKSGTSVDKAEPSISNQQSDNIPEELHAITPTQHGFGNISVLSQIHPPYGLNPFSAHVPRSPSAGTSQDSSVFGSLQQIESPNSSPSGPSEIKNARDIFNQLGSQFSNAFGSNSANQTSGSNPLSPTLQVVTSQFQNVSSQITGGFNNATSGNQPQSSIASQVQNVGSQITGGFSNATSAITGSNTNSEIQSQLLQLIQTLGPNQGSKPQQSDTIFQQIGSQFSNAFGSNSANQTSGSNPLSPTLQVFTSQFQNVSSQITGGFNNATSGNQPQSSIASQVQNVGSQITGGFSNATSAITGSNTNSEIQNELLQLIQTLGPNQGSKPQQSDTIFQQIGSQFSNAFGSNSGNQSSGSNPLDSIASQFQNVGSQITGGFSNVTNAFSGSSNSANETSGSNPVLAITSQIQSIGSQFAEGFTNATNAVTGSNNSGNQSQSGFSPLDTINSQLQNIISNFTGTITGSNNSNPPPANTSQDTGVFGSFYPLGSNSANQTSGVNPLSPITTPIQNIGSQITEGISNATGGLLPNSPFNQLSPSAVSQASNQVVDALKPASVQGQLEGFGSQLQANIPPFYKDEKLPSQTSGVQNPASTQQKPEGSSSQLQNDNPSSSNTIPIQGLFCPKCTPVCGKTNPRTLRDLRIVGGLTLTPANKYPWIARLLYFDTDQGQGSLVNDRIVVTTATLANSMPIYSQVKVQFNVFDLTSTTEQRIERTVSNVIAFPLFDESRIYDFNIGLVKLATPVTFTTTFMPICLPELFDSYAGTTAKTVGWGASSLTGQTSSVPLEVTIPLYTDSECSRSNSNINYRTLCGGVVKPAVYDDIRATCKGDDGVGLMSPSPRDSTVLNLAGITIEEPNRGCGEKNQLSVFTKTQYYLDLFIGLYSLDACRC